MNNLETIAAENTQKAFAVLRKLRAVSAWELQGAEVHLVGSLANGLYMKSRDIDLHVYTENMLVETSFAAVSAIASEPGVTGVTFTNSLHTEEACLEWHLFYKDEEGKTWNFDMIHIAKGSKYDGYFEKQAQQVKAMLTDETRRAVLQIKMDLPEDKHIGGVWIYYAVLKKNIRTAADFLTWYAQQDPMRIISLDD